MKVYMAVTTDKYELPIQIADTKEELSLKLGKCKSWACRNLSIQKKTNRKSRNMFVVEVDI